MDLDLVKREILQDVFREGMTAPTPASERQGLPGQTPATWPARMLGEARQAETQTTVKTPLPKFFNPLFRRQNLVNRSLIASSRAGANGLADVMFAAEQLNNEMEVWRRLVFSTGATPGAEGLAQMRRAAHSGEQIVTLPWVLRQTTKLAVGATVLVCGCADNLLNLELASLGYKVIGVDERECRDDHPNFKYLEANPAEPPLAAASVEAVIAMATLGRGKPDALAVQAPHEPDVKTMQAWRKVLKPGGVLILTMAFGQGSPTAMRQLYNSTSLDVLLKGWNVDAREFALGTNQHCWLYPAPEAEAGRTVVTKAGRPQAVAMVVARK